LAAFPIRRVLAVALSLAASAALAERPSSLDMTCGEARDLVHASGAIVLGTGGRTYERFVAHPGYCLQGEEVHGGWTRTSDEARCPIGLICKPGRTSSADD
jgi:hypothetical protein